VSYKVDTPFDSLEPALWVVAFGALVVFVVVFVVFFILLVSFRSRSSRVHHMNHSDPPGKQVNSLRPPY
jgi:heme/copper-type cytochrome/quinol oxidase subunit 2